MFKSFIIAIGLFLVAGIAPAQTPSCGLNLEVTLGNQNGTPIQNASATAAGANKRIVKATSFEAMPVFGTLREGKYKITVTKAGYKTTVKNIVLDCSGLESDDPSVTEYITMHKGRSRDIFTMAPLASGKGGFKAPDELVKSLFRVQPAGTGPFYQTKDRALVDRYFAKPLADLIWNDAITADGEVGDLNFDPLYGGQDFEITDLKFGDIGWGGEYKFGDDTNATVQVYFKNFGKDEMTAFILKQQADKSWKITDIRYPSGDLLSSVYSAP